MPLPVESLNENSQTAQINEAISQSISQCVNEGQEQKECVGKVFGIAKERTGKQLDFGK